MMDREEYEWYIKLVQDKRQSLNLSREQAVKIFQYERDRDNYSEKHSFSPWEEWDHELTVFREILDKSQFEKYEKDLHKSITGYQESLKDADQKVSNQISYYQSLLEYYTQQFIPEITKLQMPVLFGLIDKDHAKHYLLKEEYKKYLNDLKKQIISMHFRHNRTFQPNHLKMSLLQLQAYYLWADYYGFKFHMDEPTKSAAQFLYAKLKYIYDSELNQLNSCFAELKTFQDANFKKHYGNTGGWHAVFGDTSEEADKENKIMSMLLFEKEGYDFLPKDIL